MLYDQGLGVARDMEKAVEYYKKAAKFNEVLREKYGTEDDYASRAEKRLSEMRPRDGVRVSLWQMPRLRSNRGSPPAGRMRLLDQENSEQSEEFFRFDYLSILWVSAPLNFIVYRPQAP